LSFEALASDAGGGNGPCTAGLASFCAGALFGGPIRKAHASDKARAKAETDLSLRMTPLPFGRAIAEKPSLAGLVPADRAN
jgi:hypothetical protein